MNNRIAVHFSCGAASAVAAKLTLAKHLAEQVFIINAFMEDEHADNRRFCADCEHWFGHPITVVRDQKYDASALIVWERNRFIKGRNGASCSGRLKRDVMAPHFRQGDVHVLGYTAEEEDRFAEWLDFSGANAIAPLIENCLTKADCLAIVERAGIALPTPYLQGFDNSNCLNCCKGGMRYWLRILRFYPHRFWRAAEIQERIGPGARFLAFRSGPREGERMGLRELAAMADDIDISGDDEPAISCSFFCQMAEQDFAQGVRDESGDIAQNANEDVDI